jgi:Aspartyl/Asparaginyl beta-hydroxylase
MLELSGQPLLNKGDMVGACIRLPLRFDAPRLALEIDSLPKNYWGTTGGRVGVHRAAESVFLRGHAPAEGDLPIEDRPPLSHLPYVRNIIQVQIPAPPMRCLLARLPGGSLVAMHVDRAPYFAQTIRLHIAVTTHDRAFMYCGGHCYVMQPGELWALNNNAPHGVWNADETRARTHLICDFLPTAALRQLLAEGERDLGALRPDVESRLANPARLRSAS